LLLSTAVLPGQSAAPARHPTESGVPALEGVGAPILVVSTDAFNAWPVGLVIVVPITPRDRGFAHHIAVAGGGLDRPSFVMPEYVRSIAQRRLQRRLGIAEQPTLAAVDDWLRRLTGR
jgi:mRNA interferase MazF